MTRALEGLPRKALDRVKPERMVESVGQWDDQLDSQEPSWQGVVKEAVDRVHLEEKPIENSLVEVTAGRRVPSCSELRRS